LNASQRVEDHHLGNRLDPFGTSGFKVDRAELIAEHHALRLGTRTAKGNRKTGMPREISTLGYGDNHGQPRCIECRWGDYQGWAPSPLLLAP